MKLLKTIASLREEIKSSGLSPVGLIPTMGALHNGHISLVENGISECPLVIVTIYVNPTQFNDKEDLKKYPRTLDSDLGMLGKVLRDSDLVFVPDDREMYPAEDKRIFSFGNLDNVMEALHRPGHFNGVAQIVSRLFDITDPDLAYFGLKDFQQVAVIKALVRQKGYKVRIIENQIIREPDGLAMSSRNRLLEPELRKKAPVIFKTLTEAAAMAKYTDVPELKKHVISSIEREAGFSVEYFEIADDEELITLKNKNECKKDRSYYGCIAIKAGKIRLIDNVKFQLF